MSQDYDHLTLMEKVEVFEQAIESTSGDDLAKVLWLKSPSSEVCTYLKCCCTQYACYAIAKSSSVRLSCTYSTRFKVYEHKSPFRSCVIQSCVHTVSI